MRHPQTNAHAHWGAQPLPDDDIARLLTLLFGSEPAEAVAA